MNRWRGPVAVQQTKSRISKAEQVPTAGLHATQTQTHTHRQTHTAVEHNTGSQAAYLREQLCRCRFLRRHGGIQLRRATSHSLTHSLFASRILRSRAGQLTKKASCQSVSQVTQQQQQQQQQQQRRQRLKTHSQKNVKQGRQKKETKETEL